MDVLDVLMPEPERLSALTEAPARPSAWGPASDHRYLWNGLLLGTLEVVKLGTWRERLPPRYADRVADWKILAVSSEATERYRRHLLDPSAEVLDLEAVLMEILRVQEDWIVWAERDAEQEAPSLVAMSPDEVISGVRGLVLAEEGAHPFVAWPKDDSRS